MRNYIFIFIFILPSVLNADPHYVQALHPYWGGDKRFLEYLEKFKKPVNVEVNKYEGSKDPDVGEDWYIYIYIIREQKPINFSLNISCPNAGQYEYYTLNKEMGGMKSTNIEGVARIQDIVSSHPIRKNDPAEIINGRIVWPLDSTGEVQGMWFYSQSPPTKRAYELRANNGIVRTGSIDGPSCIASDFEQRKIHVETDPYRTYCPSGDVWLKNEKIHFVKIVARKNGCTNEPKIDKIVKKENTDYVFLSCNGTKMEFDCEFGNKCLKRCWRME